MLLKIHNKHHQNHIQARKMTGKSQDKEENITEAHEQESRNLEWNPSSHKLNFN